MGQAGKRTVRFAFWSAVLLVMLVSCQSALKDRPGGFQEEGAAGPAADDEKTELLVSAAASLTESMQILTERYEHMHPEVKVTLNLAGSGTLQKQIEQGAPVDLFVSAGTREMNALTEKGIVDPQDVRVLLRNRMAVIVPADSDIHLDNIEDLRQQDLFKIAIGEP